MCLSKNPTNPQGKCTWDRDWGDSAAETVVTPPYPLTETVLVRAISPDRDICEITFPRVAGYRVESPREPLRAKFTSDSTLVLSPGDLGPTETQKGGVVGRDANINIEHLEAERESTLLFYLTNHLFSTTWCDGIGNPKYHLFGQLKRIVREWLRNYFVYPTGTPIAHLVSVQVLAQACERINVGIVAGHSDDRPITAIQDPSNRIGSTRSVHFATTKTTLWKTDSDLCHVNWVVCDSECEAQFCRMVEGHPLTRAYVKNQGLGFEVPYRYGSEARQYVPDFIVRVDTDTQQPPMYVIVEINGFGRENTRDKKLAVEECWLPSINRLRTYGRWEFVELRDIDSLDADYSARVQEFTGQMGRGRYSPAQIAAAKRLMALGGSNPNVEHIPRRRSGL